MVVADVVDGAEVVEAIAAEHGPASVMGMVFDVSDGRPWRASSRVSSSASATSTCSSTTPPSMRRFVQTRCTEIDAALWDRVMAVNLRGPF